jgi:hypothetical protein
MDTFGTGNKYLQDGTVLCKSCDRVSCRIGFAFRDRVEKYDWPSRNLVPSINDFKNVNKMLLRQCCRSLEGLSNGMPHLG